MENFVRVFLMLVEVAQDVVREFFKWKHQQPDIQTFLQQQVHHIYHLCFNKRCCQCNPRSCLQLQQTIQKGQLDKLLVKSRPDCGRNCSCCYDASTNLNVTDIDITLCTALITNCCGTLTQQQKDSIRDIRQVRNDIAHHTHESDFNANEFYRITGKLKNGVFHLASCLSQNYSDDIQSRIRHVERRPYLAVEYTDVLRQIIQEKLERDEDTTKEIFRLEQMDERLIRIENKLDELRLSKEETVVKEMDEEQPQEGIGPIYNRIANENNTGNVDNYSKIEKLRLGGDKDPKDAIVFSVLVHIVLYGSNIDTKILEEIFSCLYKASHHEDTLHSYLENQLKSYSDEIEDCIISTFESDTVQEVTRSFRKECPESFLKICKPDILLEQMKLKRKDHLHLGFDVCEILVALFNRIPNSNDEYVAFIKGLDVSKLMDDSDDVITPERMLYLLNGITQNATEFTLFEQFENLSNTLCSPIDREENTILHIIVVNFNESEKFDMYMEYVCENKMQLMFLPNSVNLTPMDYAALLGRSKIIAHAVCNPDNGSHSIASISELAKCTLHILNPDSKELELKRHFQQLKCGEPKDYHKILELIGEDCPKETSSSNPEEAVGKFLLGIVTDIKKGFDAFTKIPDLIKTIHKATNLDEK